MRLNFSGDFFNNFAFKVVINFLTVGFTIFKRRSAIGFANTELMTAVEAITPVVETVES